MRSTITHTTPHLLSALSAFHMAMLIMTDHLENHAGAVLGLQDTREKACQSSVHQQQ